MSNLLSNELITELRALERRLKHRHGVRVVVQKMTADGVNLLCNAWRSGSPLLQRSMEEHELVALAHEAMRPLFVLGIRPLVGVVSKKSMAHVGKLDRTDPFLLQAAMDTAGIMELRPTSTSTISHEESQRRIALLKAGGILQGR